MNIIPVILAWLIGVPIWWLSLILLKGGAGPFGGMDFFGSVMFWVPVFIFSLYCISKNFLTLIAFAPILGWLNAIAMGGILFTTQNKVAENNVQVALILLWIALAIIQIWRTANRSSNDAFIDCVCGMRTPSSDHRCMYCNAELPKIDASLNAEDGKNTLQK